MSALLPAVLKVQDFITFKVYTVGEDGDWRLDENRSGPDLAQLINDWQQVTHAKLDRVEAPRALPVRDDDSSYRVLLTTMVYYTPATENTEDPFVEDGDV